MFAEIARKLNALFVASEEHERDEYLRSSVDLADLERRIRNVETGAYPLRCYSIGRCRDVSAF